MVQQLRSEKEVTGFYISGHPLNDYKFTIDRYCNVEIAGLRGNLKDYKDQTVMFAGLVTSVSQKMSKRGDPFAIFVLEDFTDSIDLMMFNEDYLKKKHLLEEGSNIFIVGKVEERYNQPGNYSVRINDVMLLSEAMNKMSEKITLKLKATDITTDLTKMLDTTVNENLGKCKLELQIEDPDNGKYLTMHVGNRGVEPRLFIHEIAKFKHISFSIN
jgi:DNA polymerase-3 subunit alpha